MTDQQELEDALVLAARWQDIRTEESYGPQGKNLGTLSRALLKLRERSATWHSPEVGALCDYKAAAIYFAEELFSLINYRRVHSLSREIWHEADAHDEQGNRCIAFLLSEGLLVNDNEEHPTWYRHKDPEKRAKPPSFDNLAVRSPLDASAAIEKARTGFDEAAEITQEAWDKLGRHVTPGGAALAMEGAPTIQENIMRVLRDHYWDSLEPQKALILKHIEGAMRWLPQKTP